MKFEFSAGGVVFTQDDAGHLNIIVSQHSQHHGWVFPKGLIGDKIQGETKENTAIREVEEEAGVKGEILKPLTPVMYWYQMDGQKIKKTVYYFLMRYVSGDIAVHDHEMENVEWVPLSAVEQKLTYKSDKIVWQEAKKLLEGGVA